MYSDDEYQEFWDGGARMAESDGHPFLIVDYDMSERDDFKAFLVDAIPAEWHTHKYWPRDFYGYTESYDVCSDCQHAICTQPTSGSADPHWFNESWGDILCVRCTQEHADDYLEWYRKEMSHGRRWKFLLDFAEHKYRLVLPNCEYGWHEGSNDSPRAIAKWARQHGFDMALDTSSDQFTVYFDVYFRVWDEDKYEARALTDEEVAQIREALCTKVDINPYHSYCLLRDEFRQWPTSADRAKAMLRGQG